MQEISSSDEDKQIRDMVLAGATDQEIADFLGWKLAELLVLCGPQITQARAMRRISLRKKQTAIAVEGNVSMLTFLGKHELGQTDRSITDESDPEPRLEPKMG